MIRQHDLFFTGQINNAPPLVSFTTMALGSFRGLIADLLWLRAASLQQDKNYFEMVQLCIGFRIHGLVADEQPGRLGWPESG